MDNTIMVIARKAFRFRNPDVTLGGAQPRNAKGELVEVRTTSDFKEAYCDVKPGAAAGAFGNPQRVPAWVKEDGMWALAFKDGDIMEIALNEQISVPVDTSKSEEAARAATLAAATAQATEAQGSEQGEGEGAQEAPENPPATTTKRKGK